jgi:hypothetical protein
VNAQLARGTNGWSTVLRVGVTMKIDRSELVSA